MKLFYLTDDNNQAKLFRIALGCAGLILSLWAFFNITALTLPQLGVFAGCIITTFLIGMFPIRIPESDTRITAGNAIVFLALIYFGVAAAVLLAVIDVFAGRLRDKEKPFCEFVSNAGIATVATFAAGNIFYFLLEAYEINRHPLGNGVLTVGHLALALAVLASAQFVFASVISAFFISVRSEKSVWLAWTGVTLSASWSVIAGIIAAGAVQFAESRFGTLAGLLSVPVVLLPYAAYKLHFRRMNQKNDEIAEMNRIQLATIQTLAAAIDAREHTSPGHTRRVQVYAIGLGKALELPAEEIKALESAALLCDIGKLAVPDYILNKPDRLTRPEMDKIKIHSAVGAEILENVGFPYPVVPTVLHHHERWDGEGYPEGLRGEEIPVTARVLAIADAYDSMRENRSYREGFTREEARRSLIAEAGTHFDPRFVDVFLRNLKRFEDEIETLGLTKTPETIESSKAPHLTNQNWITGGVPSYFAEIQRANREVFALYDLARVSTSSLNVQETVTLFVEKIQQLVPLDTCVVYFYHEKHDQAVAVHSVGKNAAFLRDRKVRLGEGVTGFVLKNQKTVCSISPALDFTSDCIEIAQDYTTMAALPLKTGDKLIGAVVCYSESLLGYEEEHLRLLETLSRVASDALWRTLQHAETESRALTDPMTGLPNARCLQMQFEKEVSRSKRTGKPFQIVMLDLDDFKLVNDTFGHKVGDYVLRGVSKAMRAQLRDYDFLARYAGDEFVAMVPELTGFPLEELCRRIEASVKEFGLPVEKRGTARVGISIGTAAYPNDGETLEQVLIAADRNMYAVKAAHKRRKQVLSGEIPRIDGENEVIILDAVS